MKTKDMIIGVEIYFSLVCLLALLTSNSIAVEKERPEREGKRAAVQSKTGVNITPQKKYAIEQALNLRLSQCIGDINFPSIGFSGNQLEIEGDRISLRSAGGVIRTGEVIAYAQSQYRLDANVALIFGRSDKPFTSPDWKAPVILSFHLIQSRKNPSQFTLVSVEGAGSIFPKTNISCAKVASLTFYRSLRATQRL